MFMFPKTLLYGSIGFSLFSFLMCVPLMSMQDADSLKQFMKKIEERDLAGVKDLVQNGKINAEMLSAGYEKAEQLKVETESNRDEKTERSEEWLNFNAQWELYKSISDYLNNIDPKIFKVYRNKAFESASSVISAESSVSCLASSSFAPVVSSRPLADIVNEVLRGRPSNTETSMSQAASDSVSSDQSQHDETQSVPPSSSSYEAVTLTTEEPEHLAQQLAATSTQSTSSTVSSLSPILEESQDRNSPRLATSLDPQLQTVANVRCCNCFYTVICMFWYYMTAPFIKEKSI